MIIFICGGSKSGKSSFSELISSKICKDDGRLVYIATMKPTDEEDLNRIERHIEDRKKYNFRTYEVNRNIKSILDKLNYNDTVLLDSITSLVTNEMFVGNDFNKYVSENILEGIKKISSKVNNIVFVSDYIFNDSIIYDKFTESFRRELGHVNRNISTMADVSIECLSGKNIIVYKGREVVENEGLI